MRQGDRQPRLVQRQGRGLLLADVVAFACRCERPSETHGSSAAWPRKGYGGIERDDVATRPNFRRRGYSGDWDKLSAAFLEACPYCLGCWSVNIVEPAVIADHIRPLALINSIKAAVSSPAGSWARTCDRHAPLRTSTPLEQTRQFQPG